MMERAIFQFEPEQLKGLRTLASARGVSVATLVREAVDAMLAAYERDAAWERAQSLAGRFSSGTGDLGRRHDDYLGEAEW